MTVEGLTIKIRCSHANCESPACTLVAGRWRCLQHTKQALEEALADRDYESANADEAVGRLERELEEAQEERAYLLSLVAREIAREVSPVITDEIQIAAKVGIRLSTVRAALEMKS